MTSPKTFETATEAKEFCLAQFCKPCKITRLCNSEVSEAKDYWRNCLKVRRGLCSHYVAENKLSYCNNPQISTDFCLGKQCPGLPIIVIEEEQTIFNFGASAPGGVDFKEAAAGERDEEIPF